MTRTWLKIWPIFKKPIEMTQILESVDKDCKAAFVFVDTKENTLIIKIKKSQKERKTFRKNQMEILELRNTKSKIIYIMFQYGQFSKEREREQTS